MMKSAMKSLKKIRLMFLGFLVLLLPVLFFAGQKVQQYFIRASGVPANITVQTSIKLEPLKSSWNALAQGGEESVDMIAPVIPEIKALKPRYIRIDHLYDHFNVVSRNGDGGLSYDFTSLDGAVKSILATGALPFLSLSYMPAVLTSTGNITDAPQNWNEWSQVVERTIEHYSGLSELNLSDVYYEVWNEPDLFGDWKYYGDKNYLTLYSYAARGAERAKNTSPFKIGGPATTQLYKNWVTQMAKFVTANNLRLDFFSWHRYTYDPVQYTKDVTDVTRWLFPYPNLVGIPRIISEWGFDPAVHPGYDGNLAAAHTVASIRQALYGYEQIFTFEPVDGPDPGGQEYWGRWGLITYPEKGKHLKPRYLALKLMNQIGGTRLLLKGEGTWVTGIATQKDTTIQLLLVNFDKYSQHIEQTPVTITGLTDGDYSLKTTRLTNANSAVPITVSGGIYTTTVTLPVNTVTLLELTPEASKGATLR